MLLIRYGTRIFVCCNKDFGFPFTALGKIPESELVMQSLKYSKNAGIRHSIPLGKPGLSQREGNYIPCLLGFLSESSAVALFSALDIDPRAFSVKAEKLRQPMRNVSDGRAAQSFVKRSEPLGHGPKMNVSTDPNKIQTNAAVYLVRVRTVSRGPASA